MFEIQKNVPIPAQERAGKNEPVYDAVVETFQKLAVGESFFVPKAMASPSVLKTKIKELLTSVLKEKEAYKYATSTSPSVKEGEPEEATGLRIWKIESKQKESDAPTEDNATEGTV
jgi:hypothetical protein